MAERALSVIEEFQSRRDCIVCMAINRVGARQLRGVIHAMPRLRGRRAQFQHYARLRDLFGSGETK